MDVKPKLEILTEVERLKCELEIAHARIKRLEAQRDPQLGQTSDVKDEAVIDLDDEKPPIKLRSNLSTDVKPKLESASNKTQDQRSRHTLNPGVEIIEISDDEETPIELRPPAISPIKTKRADIPHASEVAVGSRGRQAKPRQVMECVELTLRDVSRVNRPPYSRHLLKREHTKSPSSSNPRPSKEQKKGPRLYKPCLKKDTPARLPEDVVVAFIGLARALKIKPPPDEALHFPRGKLVTYIGFRPQDLLFRLRKVATLPARYVARDVICGTREINPYLPTRPGEPGLMCSVRKRMANGAPWSMFLRRKAHNRAVWLYAGEYVFVHVGALTAAQFKDQSADFHTAWAEKILRTVQFDEYVRMHAEIALRKWGHAITEEAVAEEMAQIRTKSEPLPLTTEDVVGALSRGEQKIDIVRMECASYDHEFVRDIAAICEQHA
ncbi:hypothetical protein DFH07DRAFT_823269 [Mycena maculata]|uniref:DUF6697 domain-containing protein n=1 Tax=Mycena maculata TaxID=230809 RepID=A0AAD7NBU4_9AGAR|nr:hypothetical protein DFH07DRAFT_823269 [Mycena maculata]